MKVYQLSAIVFTVLLLTVGCKKDEEGAVNQCLNGKLDAGETDIDCGGSCGACPSTEYPYAGFSLYGQLLSMPSKQLIHSTNWSLQLANDTIDVHLNLGNSGATGTFSMNASGSEVIYDGLHYSILTSGTYSITQHNTTMHKMSGFFQGKFVRPGISGDTLRITNGSFEYIPY